MVPGCKRTTKYWCEDCGYLAACDRTNTDLGCTCFVALHTDEKLIQKAQRKIAKIASMSEREHRNLERENRAKQEKRLRAISN